MAMFAPSTKSLDPRKPGEFFLRSADYHGATNHYAGQSLRLHWPQQTCCRPICQSEDPMPHACKPRVSCQIRIPSAAIQLLILRLLKPGFVKIDQLVAMPCRTEFGPGISLHSISMSMLLFSQFDRSFAPRFCGRQHRKPTLRTWPLPRPPPDDTAAWRRNPGPVIDKSIAFSLKWPPASTIRPAAAFYDAIVQRHLTPGQTFRHLGACISQFPSRSKMPSP